MGKIVVENLGKAFRQYPSRWGRLIEWLDPRGILRHQLHWVIKKIDFEIEAGSSVGVIGINGAGKSTFLKLIAGTLQPTVGRISISGNVSALLELGMGFHADFTGRENVFMAGQLIGMTPEEIAYLMPEIEAFADIGEYIDQPVRIYSSGMQVRLAFSVATARRPEILIVDEALSVGDAHFQHKSFERIREFRKQGTTLLIVSHDKQAIQSICDRAILLDSGVIAMDGEPEAVLDYYNARLADHQSQQIRQETQEDGKSQTISGNGEAVIESVSLVDNNQIALDVVNVGQMVRLKIEVRARARIPDLVVGYMVKDRFGQSIFGTNTHHLNQKPFELDAESGLSLYFDFPANFGEGSYSIAVALHAEDTHLHKSYEWRDRACFFNVINLDKEIFVGSAWVPPHLEYELHD